jgi:methionyl-tRNA formyltransferase
VEYLNQYVCHVDLVVTISEALTENAVISGYSPLRELRAAGTDVFEAAAYTLDDAETTAFFGQNLFGIGISMGWSRLIPESVLDRFESGVFGLHGSCGYLPYGQGRATLNWSLIQGDWRYVMHVFKLDKYADSPNIYAKEMFEVNEFDDIRTLQYKDLLASRRLISGLLHDYTQGVPLVTTHAGNDVKQWYKGRKPEDGRIDMSMKTREIYNLVRGVTRPFPGAFAYANGERVLIWTARPFDRMMDFSACKLGEIMDILDGNLLVRTVDGSLLVTDYTCAAPLRPGDVLT